MITSWSDTSKAMRSSGQLVAGRLGGGGGQGEGVFGGCHVLSRRGRSATASPYRPCLAMYWTTPSGTRYQTGSPRATRSRQSVELIASAGISTSVSRSAGSPVRDSASSRWPGRVQPDEAGQLEHLVVVAPGEDLRERVGAGDEEELVLGTPRPQVAQGVDRVRGPVAVDVDPAHREARVGRRGDHGHQVAVLARRDPLVVPSATAGRWGRTPPRRGRTSACTSLAATRWPWCTGSKVPPMMPTRRLRGAGPSRGPRRPGVRPAWRHESRCAPPAQVCGRPLPKARNAISSTTKIPDS